MFLLLCFWVISLSCLAALCQSWGLGLRLWVGGSGWRGEILAFQKQRFRKEPFRRRQSQEFQVSRKSSYCGFHVLSSWNSLLTIVVLVVAVIYSGWLLLSQRQSQLQFRKNDHPYKQTISRVNLLTRWLCLPQTLPEINDCVYLLIVWIAQDLSPYAKV